MRVARIGGFLMAGLLGHEALAQNPGSAEGSAPLASPALRPSPWPGGRLGVMAGMMYRRGDAYSAHLSGLYYLTPENRPLSFRVQGYVAWSPFQRVITRAPNSWTLAPNSWTLVNSGSATQIGGGIAAILHARPKSRVSPYLIASYGRSGRWQDGTYQEFDAAEQAIAPPTPWVHSYSWGEFGVGGGIRARVGSQVVRLEVTSADSRLALSLGMSLPF